MSGLDELDRPGLLHIQPDPVCMHLRKNKDKVLGNAAIQIKQKCFVMYVEVSEGAYRAHTKCPSGESFKGAARCFGTIGKKTAESSSM